MNPKAIKIDLSIFFDDERKFCRILMDSNWKTVACLQNRLQLLFDLDCVRLLSDGCFLPPQESIEIITFCKDIKAFAPKETLKLKKKKKSKKNKNTVKLKEKSSNEESDFTKFETQISVPQRKRKSISIESGHSCKSISKKSKRSKYDIDQELESTKSTKNSKLISVLENRSNNKIKSQTTENSSEKITLVQKSSDDEYKKRHTSTPKEKEESETEKANNMIKSINDEIQITTPRLHTSPSSFLDRSKMLERENSHRSSNCSRSKNPFRNSISSRAHIFFDETGGEVASPANKKALKTKQKKDKEPKTIGIFRCPLNDVTNGTQTQKPRIFHLKLVNRLEKLSNKQTIEIREQIILPPLEIANITKNNLSLSKEGPETNDDVNKIKETNESINKTDEANSIQEESSLNNKEVDTDTETTAVIKPDEDEQQLCVNDLEDTTANKTHTESQLEHKNSDDETTSDMAVDCVDLSNCLDEDDIEEQREKVPEIEHDTTTHDLTANNEYSKLSTSDIEEISEIIDLNETEENCNNSTQHNNSLKDIRIEKMLPYLTDLKDLPSVEDIIVFKVPYLNKKKKIVNTNFIAGKVDYINRRTKTIKILVIDGRSELWNVPNQFACNLDDSQDCDKYLQIKLSDICESKLFSKT